MSFMAKNHVFLAIPPSGTHLHLHFDDEYHGDERNYDLFGSVVLLWSAKRKVKHI